MSVPETKHGNTKPMARTPSKPAKSPSNASFVRLGSNKRPRKARRVRSFDELAALHDQEMITTAETAQLVDTTPQTLCRWAKGDDHLGPPFIQVGGHKRYRIGDVRQWLDSITVGG